MSTSEPIHPMPAPPTTASGAAPRDGVVCESPEVCGETGAPALVLESATPVASLPAGPLCRQVLVLALPMLGEQLGVFMVGLVDTWLAGTLSKEATAAVGSAGYLGWFLTLAFTLIGVGAAALVSRSYGARDVATANRTLNQALLLAVVLGALTSLTAYLIAPALATAFSTTPQTRALCERFLRISAAGFLLASVTMLGGAVLRAAGDTRTPMLIMLAVNVVNVTIALALVYGAGWGVDGIAIATVLARCIGGIAMLGVLARGTRGLALRRGLLRPDWPILRRVLRIGLPAAGESACMWTAQLCFISIVAHTAAGAAGTVNFAAHVIAVQIEAISYLPAMAWMTASATMVGQYLGARQPERARRAGHVAAAQGALLGATVGCAFFLLADWIFAQMTQDPDVRRVGANAFRWLGIVQPFLVVGIIYVGSLRGAGDTRGTLLISAISNVGVRVPVAFLGGILLQGGLLGAWAGMWADNVTRCVLVSTRFARGKWQRISV